MLNGSKAIRGGIPLVFPQFGIGPQSPKVQHGFARASKWQWLGVERETTTELVAAFLLESTAETLAVWPHRFRLKFTVVLRQRSLRTRFDLLNCAEDQSSFSFTALFHTYFRVPAIENVRVRGLQGLQYKDKLISGDGANGGLVEPSNALAVTGEVDRVYTGWNGRRLDLLQLGSSFMTITAPVGLPDVVVWNPWVAKAKAMADFGDEEYREMICIEAGAVDKEVTLSVGETWSAEQQLSLD